MRFTTRLLGVLGALVAASFVGTGCGGGDDPTEGGQSKGEVVITCEACAIKPTEEDVFGQVSRELTAAFNAEYKGRYRVESKPYQEPGNVSELVQHYSRQAASDTLPDIFKAQATVVRDLARSGKLMDFAPVLEEDGAWKRTFTPDAFQSLTDDQGRIWGVPEQRDVVGIFYNRDLFRKAGVTEFPKTWEELLQTCSQLKAAEVIPFAMDGDWVTQLMWSNLVGTTPGGPEFLQSGITDGGYADNANVVQATEFLAQLHTDGCVNEDAFSGDYNRAAAPFLDGQAAMIANGPWMVPQIDGAREDIDAGYEISPGDGLIVIPGGTGWASGATDDAQREAVAAFMKFMTSFEQEFAKAVKTGSYWPTVDEPTRAQAKQLEPLGYQLFQQADSVASTYPHSKFATPPAFTTTWVNDWPAYVQGQMSTEDFLDGLADAVTRQR